MKLLLERMQSSLIKKESEYKTPKNYYKKQEIVCYYKITHIHLLFSKFYKLVDRSYNKLTGLNNFKNLDIF